MNAQTLLEILLQAANAGIDLSSLQVAYPVADPEYASNDAEEVEITDGQLLIS